MKEDRDVNKIVRFVQTYLIYGFPFVIACIIWDSLQSQTGMVESSIISEVLAFNLMFWFLMCILFLIMLVGIPSVREKTLRRLANLKERDEREEYITGKASRSAYISTLSLIIFCLFFSVFSFNIYRLPPSPEYKGKHMSVSINLGYSLLAKNPIENKSKDNRTLIFSSVDIAPSTSSLLLLILFWQLLIFNLAARKEQKS